MMLKQFVTFSRTMSTPHEAGALSPPKPLHARTSSPLPKDGQQAKLTNRSCVELDRTVLIARPVESTGASELLRRWP